MIMQLNGRISKRGKSSIFSLSIRRNLPPVIFCYNTLLLRAPDVTEMTKIEQYASRERKKPTSRN